MTPDEWYARRNDRQTRYAGRVLPPGRPILVELEPEYGTRFDGQVAGLVAANLFSRMSPRVAFDFPQASIVHPLPWAGKDLGTFALETACAADPFGMFELRHAQAGDYVVHLGRENSPASTHGSGWGSFVGPGGSPLASSDDNNPVGPAFAVIVVAARLFGLNLEPLDGPYLFNTFNWTNAAPSDNEPFPSNLDLGQLWCVGAGSVGTAALYFITLATREFASVVFDMDEVKIENLDRSPIFTAEDAKTELRKAIALERYLRQLGVKDVQAEVKPLDLSSRWKDRQQNEPDILISAANERNVRYVVEQSFPPLQIYATTGGNWNVSAFRHIPFVDPCSCCAFPPERTTARMACASGSVHDPETGKSVDAALPFLSFAAGLFAAAEVFKAQLPGYPFPPNRFFFVTSPETTPGFVLAPMRPRESCVCQSRSRKVHWSMIGESRYAEFSSSDLARKAASS